ncbi:AtpZ/AtpI family protein [bacterium]|nr:MAG: AtpZ/AtpI family protein [bacterium]
MKIRRELEKEGEIDELDAKEARLLELGDLNVAKVPDLPEVDEYDERLRDLHSKTFAAREMRESQNRQEARERAADQESYRGLGTGLQIAYAIIGLPIFGFGAGWLLDRALNANGWKPILTMLGAVVGIGYAIWTLNRENQTRDS